MLIATAVAASCVPASAVQVSPQGLGQVLLYPYYTTRTVARSGPYNTLFIVTNTSTTDTKVVRVRFRESLNGRPVASLNVYLVPNDSWAAGVVPDSGSGGAALYWTDQSCTDPPPAPAPPMLRFENSQYSGPNSDFEDPSLARTSEGWFEVFELGVVKDSTVLAALKTDRTYAGVKPDCPPALAVPLDSPAKIGPPTGGLMGSAFIANVYASTMYSYDATALDDFSRVALWTPPTATAPTLEDVNPKLSRVLDGAVLRQNAWEVAKGARPADPVSAVLMQDQLLNYWVLDFATASGTDWIVTMPTKPHYVALVGAVAPPSTPFASSFNKGGAPDSFATDLLPCPPPGFTPGVTLVVDREGSRALPREGCFGVPPTALTLTLPWTANVVTFNKSAVFASGAYLHYGTPSQNGWMRLAPLPNSPPSSAHKLVSTDSPPATFYGLPMIGFMANSYYNGTVPDPYGPGTVLTAYGATSPHKGKPRIE